MEDKEGVEIKLNFGDRKFYEIKIPSYFQCDDSDINKAEASKKLFKYVEDHCIGKDLVFAGPYGKLPGRYYGLNIAAAA